MSTAPLFPMPSISSSNHEANRKPIPPEKNELYALPELVEVERQGWIVSAQAAAVVSALLCGVETALLTLIKTPDPNNHPLRDTNPAAFRFLLLLSYSALVFNASSTIASLVMLDRLGEIPERVAKLGPSRKPPPEDGGSEVDARDAYRLESYQAGFRWTWARIHCLGALFAGASMIFIQICLYVWLREATSVAITMSVVCVVGVLPLFMFYVKD